VGLRQRFDLDVCIRPCRSFPGNPLNFVRQTADGGMDEPDVDAVIFRQNTEGLYAGVEWTIRRRKVRDALNTHPKFKRFADTPPRTWPSPRASSPAAPATGSCGPRSSTR
jgi:isocitrate dehydrogenase (NAD+)